KTLHAALGTAASVQGAVGTGCVPGHTNKEWTVVAVVSWPPVLGSAHDIYQVLLEVIQIDSGNQCLVVQLTVRGIANGLALAQRCQIQAVRPPVVVSRHRVLGGCGLDNHRAQAHGCNDGNCQSCLFHVYSPYEVVP